LTHCEFRLGKADWSDICSRDSGGSWYIILLERLLLPVFVVLMVGWYEEGSDGASLASGVKEMVLWRAVWVVMKGDVAESSLYEYSFRTIYKRVLTAWYMYLERLVRAPVGSAAASAEACVSAWTGERCEAQIVAVQQFKSARR
jgi:hypothetical protein